jgi:hypothetical protein
MIASPKNHEANGKEGLHGKDGIVAPAPDYKR